MCSCVNKLCATVSSCCVSVISVCYEPLFHLIISCTVDPGGVGLVCCVKVDSVLSCSVLLLGAWPTSPAHSHWFIHLLYLYFWDYMWRRFLCGSNCDTTVWNSKGIRFGRNTTHTLAMQIFMILNLFFHDDSVIVTYLVHYFYFCQCVAFVFSYQ